MSYQCPHCGRESNYHEDILIEESHPKATAVWEDDPHEHERDDYEVVIDKETGFVLREPIEITCRCCGGVWVEEWSRTNEEVERELRRNSAK